MARRASGTLKALVVNPAARTVEEVGLPVHANGILPSALASHLGISPDDAIDYLDLTGDGPGDRVLVDTRQDGHQTHWWSYGPTRSFGPPATAEEAVDTAALRLIFDPGDEAPIGGVGVIAHLDPATGRWSDARTTREEALAAVRFGP